MQSPPGTRQYYADWLKVICIFLLLPYHAAMIFGPTHFGIKNSSVHPGYNIFNELIGMWYFSLLMYLSGMAAFLSLSRRSGKQFLGSRFSRLLVPLLFGMLVVIPPQVYVERLQQHQIRPGYLAFYTQLFNGVYPAGNLTWAQLWYLAYLFVISLALLPLCTWLKKDPPFLQGLTRLTAAAPFALLLWALPLMLVEYFLRAQFPFGNQNLVSDWANVLHFCIVYLYGFIIAGQPSLQAAVVRCRQIALVIAVAGVLLYYVPYVGGYFIPGDLSPLQQRIIDAWRGLNAWCWVLAIIGYCSVYLRNNNRVLQYAAHAFLPVYILHQTILLCAAYYIIQWPMQTFLKFVLLTLLSYAFSLLIYEYLIRNNRYIRFLFGG